MQAKGCKAFFREDYESDEAFWRAINTFMKTLGVRAKRLAWKKWGLVALRALADLHSKERYMLSLTSAVKVMTEEEALKDKAKTLKAQKAIKERFAKQRRQIEGFLNQVDDPFVDISCLAGLATPDIRNWRR